MSGWGTKESRAASRAASNAQAMAREKARISSAKKASEERIARITSRTSSSSISPSISTQPKTLFVKTERGTYVEVDAKTGATIRYVGTAPLGETRETIPATTSERQKFEYKQVTPEQYQSPIQEAKTKVDQFITKAAQLEGASEQLQTGKVPLREAGSMSEAMSIADEEMTARDKYLAFADQEEPKKLSDPERESTSKPRFVPEYLRPEEPRKSSKIFQQLYEKTAESVTFKKLRKEIVDPVITAQPPEKFPKLYDYRMYLGMEKGLAQLRKEFDYIEGQIHEKVGLVSGRVKKEKRVQEAAKLTKAEEEKLKDLETTGGGVLSEYEKEVKKIQKDLDKQFAIETFTPQNTRRGKVIAEFEKKFSILQKRAQIPQEQDSADKLMAEFERTKEQYNKRLIFAEQEDWKNKTFKVEAVNKKLESLSQKYDEKIKTNIDVGTKEIQTEREKRIIEAQKSKGFLKETVPIFVGDVISETAFTLTGGSAFKALDPMGTTSYGRRALYALDTALVFGGPKTISTGIKKITPKFIRTPISKFSTKLKTKTLSTVKKVPGVKKIKEKITDFKIKRMEKLINKEIQKGNVEIIGSGQTVFGSVGDDLVTRTFPVTKTSPFKLRFKHPTLKGLDITSQPYTKIITQGKKTTILSKVTGKVKAKKGYKLTRTDIVLQGVIDEKKGLLIGTQKTAKGKELVKLFVEGKTKKPILRPETIVEEIDDLGIFVRKKGTVILEGKQATKVRFTSTKSKFDIFAKAESRKRMDLLLEVQKRKPESTIEFNKFRIFEQGKSKIQDGITLSIRDVYTDKSVSLMDTKIKKSFFGPKDTTTKIIFEPARSGFMSELKEFPLDVSVKAKSKVTQKAIKETILSGGKLKAAVISKTSTKTAQKQTTASLISSFDVAAAGRQLLDLTAEVAVRTGKKKVFNFGFPRLAVGGAIKNLNMKPSEIKTLSLSPAKINLISPKINTKQFSFPDIKPSQTITPSLKIKQITEPVITEDLIGGKLDIPKTGGDIIIVEPAPVTPTISTPWTFPSMGIVPPELGRRTTKKKETKQRFDYTPTLEAAIFGIKQKKKTKKGDIFTGLELRGLPTRKKQKGISIW